MQGLHSGLGSLMKGAFAAFTCAVLWILVWWLLLPYPWFVPIGLLGGVVVAIFVWNQGVVAIPVRHRGLCIVLGARQPGAENELGEGLHWVLPGITTVEPYEMVERSALLPDVTIETKDKNTIRAAINIQWAVKEGQLFAFSNVEDIQAAFDAEARAVARAFGVSRETIGDFIDTHAAETLKQAVYRHLRRRASGELNVVRIAADGTVSFESSDGETARPWGLDVISVSVPSFILPERVSAVAADPERAQIRRKAAQTIQEGIVEVTQSLRDTGVDPHVAVNVGQTAMNPDTPLPDKTTVIAGLQEGMAALGAGIAAISGAAQEPPRKKRKPRKAIEGEAREVKSEDEA